MLRSIFSVQKWKYLFKMFNDIRKVNQRLKDIIEDAGIIEETHFVKLNGGYHFFSYPAKEYQKQWYFLLNKKIKRYVPPECMNVLFDISFRYVGPKSKQEAFDEGKYLDVDAGAHVIEIGAFIGLQAIRMSEKVGEKGRVVAVEAVKENFELMKKNIEYNGISNIDFYNVAIWKEKGTLDFYFDDAQKNSADASVVKHKRVEVVPCDTIDNIIQISSLRKVDFVRIQVNGVEKEAIEGMPMTIKNRPKILVAVPYKNRLKIKGKLEENSYKVMESKHSLLAEV
ncbi:MAG: FkbM family methyltransferase [Cyclobacteriaceae bacterium]|nr:FkbM family methyltransferase [Cyclobacteriaceae bacterium]